MIPQCNPHASYVAQRGELDAAVARVLAGGHYILGEEVRAFEREFAAYVGVGKAFGVANGTDALRIALQAAGIRAGDRVLTVSHTAVATVVAIRGAGAEPVFVDVDEANGLMDTGRLEETLGLLRADGGAPVRGIVPVHLYGECVDMDAVSAIARSNGLVVVEDCAQAHGASIGGRRAGSWGACSSFSFYPTKNLGAFGDGGAVATNDPAIAERIALLREYGWRERYVSDIEGTNSRLDELQAAMLRVKLGRLDECNARRQAIAARYLESIENPAVQLPAPRSIAGCVFHQFAVRTTQRDDFRTAMARRGVGTLIHYPVPVHAQPAYSSPRYRPLPLGSSERWAATVASLPMFPELTDEQVGNVIRAVNEWRAPE